MSAPYHIVHRGLPSRGCPDEGDWKENEGPFGLCSRACRPDAPRRSPACAWPRAPTPASRAGPTRTASSSPTWPAPVAARTPFPAPPPPEGPARERWSRAYFTPEPPAPVVASLESAAGVALAVIDGMSGNSPAGHVAARIAADTFAAELAVSPPSGDGACRRRVVEAINAACRAIFEETERRRSCCMGMGAAALLALVSGDRLHLAGAGDGRAYILRLGRLVQATRDDTLLNAARALRGVDLDVSTIPAFAITKALGIHPDVDVQASTFELRAGRRHPPLHRRPAPPRGRPHPSLALIDLPDPADAAVALIDMAKRRGGEDDITVVVARTEGDDLCPPGVGDVLENHNVP